MILTFLIKLIARFFYLSIILGSISLFAQSQNNSPESLNFTLSGIIKDAQTGESLPFASVLIKGTNDGATTNMDGYFTLNEVPSDTSVLVINYIGYDDMEFILSPKMSKTNLVIEIEPSSISLDAVEVVAEREELMKINRFDISTIKMTPKKIAQLPSIGEKDIMRSFQLMPGVSGSNESSSGMYVRGGTPDQNLIVYDGFTIYHVDHLYGFYSAFNSNAIKDVQLYKGGFESRFGGRLSSVTEITGKDGNQKNFNIGGDLSLLSVNAFVEIPIGDKFSSIVAFRRSYKGPIYNNIFDQFNEDSSESSTQNQQGDLLGRARGRGLIQETTPTSFFYDLNGKLTFRPNDKDQFSLSFFNGTDKLDDGYGVDTPSFLADRGINFNVNITDLTNYGNLGSSFKWARKWSPKLYGNTIFSYSNYYSERNRDREGNIIFNNGDSNNFNSGINEDNNLKDLSFKSDYQWNISKDTQLQFGAFGSNYDIEYSYTQNDTISIINRDDKGMLAGGYLQGKINLNNNKIQIESGIRTSYFDVTQKMYYEPRASIVINANKKLSLKGAYGKYYQFANRVVREDITAGSRDFWILSNGENIPVSSATHYIAGLTYETKDYLFSAEGYYKKLDGLSEYSLRYNTSLRDLDYSENFYNGSGFTKGIEFLAQKKFGKINGWISYTLGEARNKFDIYGEDDFPAYQDVNHEFKAVGLYKNKRWNFSATWIFATGRPYTGPSGTYSPSLLDGSTQDYFTTTTKNGLRFPDYHRLDLSANYNLYSSRERNEIGYIGFSLFNVYNRKNSWYNQYEVVDGGIVETQINYLGIMPNITLSLKLR